MKNLLVLTTLILSTLARAEDLSMEKLAGTWSAGCTQSQMQGKKGHVIESYSFTKEGNFEFERSWFKDQACKGEAFEKDTEKGQIKIGKENTNNGLNPAGTYEVEYKTSKGTDKGLLWLGEESMKMRVSRGMGTSQNTMLGIFIFTKR